MYMITFSDYKFNSVNCDGTNLKQGHDLTHSMAGSSSVRARSSSVRSISLLAHWAASTKFTLIKCSPSLFEG